MSKQKSGKMASIFILLMIVVSGISQPINTQKLDSLFHILDSNHLAMGSVAIAKAGKIIYQKQIGYAYTDSSKKNLANAETKYRIGSISKMFTAVVVFQLIEEGKLSLDTKLAKYYPKMPNADKITIEMLLRHRSGLVDYINDSVDAAKNWIIQPHSDEVILQKLINSKPHFSPDSTMSYCNSGYYLLAKIAEHIDKNKFENILQNRIYSKIALKNTHSDSLNNEADNDAFAYSYTANGWKLKSDFYFNNTKGCGNLLSTPTDLIQFIQALFDYKLVKKSSLDSMMRFSDLAENPVAFGSGIMRVPPFHNQTADGYGHTGGTYGQSSTLFDFTKDSLIIAQSFNSLQVPINQILTSELNICYNNPEDFSSYKKIKTYPITEKDLDKYLGLYLNKQYNMRFTITKQANELYARFGQQNAYPYTAIEKDKFEYKQANVVLQFDTEKHTLTLFQNGGEVLFTKEK